MQRILVNKFKDNKIVYHKNMIAILSDNNISLEHKGIYAYLWAKPNHCELSDGMLLSETKESIKKSISLIETLIKLGYIEKRVLKCMGITYWIEYHIVDKTDEVQ